MKQLIILVIIFLSFGVLNAQDSKNMVVGKFNYEQWLQETGWSTQDSVKYNPSDSVILLLKPIVEEQKIGFIVFAGSWCGDTKSELHKIISVIKALGVDLINLPIFGLDRDKYEPSFTAKRMNIQKVPTLIITYQNEEIGRIIEFPEKGSTWELDILRIFR